MLPFLVTLNHASPVTSIPTLYSHTRNASRTGNQSPCLRCQSVPAILTTRFLSSNRLPAPASSPSPRALPTEELILEAEETSPAEQQNLFLELWKEVNAQAYFPPLDIFPVSDLDGDTNEAKLVFRGLFIPQTVPQHVQPGTVLISVPLSFAITVQVTSSKSGRTANGKPAVAELASSLIETLISALNASPTSDPFLKFWSKWVQMLPKELPSITDWEERDLRELQFEGDVTMVYQSRESQESLIEQVVQRTGVGYELAKWALRIVLSRSFTLCVPGNNGINSESEQWIQAIVPLLDLANHSPEFIPRALLLSGTPSPCQLLPGYSPRSPNPVPARALWRVSRGPPTDALEGTMPAQQWHVQLVARNRLTAGKEVTISYGPHDSLTFMTNFGFLPQVNPGGKAVLYSSLQEVIDDVDYRVKLVRRKEESLGSLFPRETPFWVLSGGSAPVLMDVLYVVHASSAEEFEYLQRTLRVEKSLSSAKVHPSTRCAAARQLYLRSMGILESLPTSLQEDVEELSNPSTRPVGNKFEALEYVIMQKNILHECKSKYEILANLQCSVE